MKSTTVILVLVLSVLGGGIGGVLQDRLFSETTEDRIAEFYLTETAVNVSPHDLQVRMDEGDDSFLVVDLRSGGEYDREHIVGAMSIPGSADAETIYQAFATLDQSKEIIVHCYSESCMLGRNVGAMLAERGIFVKHLGVGWAEWKAEADDKYIVAGSEPGELEASADAEPETCPTDGSFGC